MNPCLNRICRYNRGHLFHWEAYVSVIPAYYNAFDRFMPMIFYLNKEADTGIIYPSTGFFQIIHFRRSFFIVSDCQIISSNLPALPSASGQIRLPFQWFYTLPINSCSILISFCCCFILWHDSTTGCVTKVSQEEQSPQADFNSPAPQS